MGNGFTGVQGNSSEYDVDVAIIGAGPAGLTAGYLLSKKGLKVAIIEKDTRYVGGISRTVEHEGYRFDIGGHRFLKVAAGCRSVERDLPDDFIQRPRMSRIFSKANLLLSAARVRGAAQPGHLALHHLHGELRSVQGVPDQGRRKLRGLDQQPVRQKLYSIFFKTYTEKVWGMPCNEHERRLGRTAHQGPSLGSAVVDGLKRSLGLNKRPSDGMQPDPARKLRYPRQGPGMMWEAARDKIVAAGGLVLMGHAMKQLAGDGQGGWRLSASCVDADGNPSGRDGHPRSPYDQFSPDARTGGAAPPSAAVDAGGEPP